MARWHIVGAGAIGTTWLHKLRLLQHDVSLIVKDQSSVDTYRRMRPIEVFDSGQRYYYEPEVLRPSDLQQPLQKLLVCTKSWQCSAALQSLSSYFNKHTQIIILQNGYGQFVEARDRYPQVAIYAATTTDGAFLTKPYRCTIAANGDTHIGAFNQCATTQAILPGANYDANIEARLWQKLCINAVINPITALEDVANGDIYRIGNGRIATLCNELQALTNTLGYQFDIAEDVRRVATLTASNSSSMRQDIKQRRRTEIEEISGYLLGLAKKMAIETPTLLADYRAINQISR